MIEGRRHRALGQLHPEGRARRHDPVDPRGEHDRRQALWLAVPARCDRQPAGIRASRPRPDLPDAAPATWDEYLANAKAIVDSGAAPFGATFDSHGWRSLAPDHAQHEHATSTRRRACSTSPATPPIEALKLMKKIMALSHPDILLEGASDGGVNGTPDEVAFAAQRVAYYTKYFNAPLRMATNWDDPKLLHLGPLPKFANGEGSTVFWTTGCALFKHGKNKEKAAEYIRALTYDPQIWKDSIAGTRAAIRASCRPTSPSTRNGTPTSRTGCPRSSRWCAASSTRPRRSPTTSSACSSSSSASRIWETYPQGRGSRSEGGHAEGHGGGPGRDEARLTRSEIGAHGPGARTRPGHVDWRA